MNRLDSKDALHVPKGPVRRKGDDSSCESRGCTKNGTFMVHKCWREPRDASTSPSKSDRAPSEKQCLRKLFDGTARESVVSSDAIST